MNELAGLFADQILRNEYAGTSLNANSPGSGEEERRRATFLVKVLETRKRIQNHSVFTTATSSGTAATTTHFLDPDMVLIGSVGLETTLGVFVPCRPNDIVDFQTVWDVKNWIYPIDPNEVRAITLSSSDIQATVVAEPTAAELVEEIRVDLARPDAEQIAERVQTLLDAAREDYPDLQISASSLQAFIQFLRSYPNLVRPELVLTPYGNIRAEWTKNQDRHFAVEFVNGEVRYVVFAPNRKYVGHVLRSSGIATIDTVMSIVKPHSVDSWVMYREDTVNEGRSDPRISPR